MLLRSTQNICFHREIRKKITILSTKNVTFLELWRWFGILHLIMKTYLYNFDPLKPRFYKVKLGFTRVYIIFLISAQKHGLWVLIRNQGSSNKYPQSMFWAKIWKISEFLSENFQFLVVKFSIYLTCFCNVFQHYLCHMETMKGW